VWNDTLRVCCVLLYEAAAAEGLSKALTDSLSAFADESDKEQTEMLLDALASSIGRALQSSALMGTVKTSIIETVSDDELQTAVINTVQAGMRQLTMTSLSRLCLTLPRELSWEH